MKKRVTVLIMAAALLFMTNGFAQVQLGFQGGVNLGDVSLDPTPEGTTTSMRTGFIIGGVLFYSFTPIFGLQVEPAFVQKGASVDISVTEMGMNLKAEQSVTANYLDVPILIRATFGEAPVKPYLLAGPTIAFSLGDAEFEIEKATLDGQDITSQIPSGEREVKQKVKSIDFILAFGGGVIIPAGTTFIFIEAQYNLGLTNINDEPADPGEPEVTVKTKGIQIKAGMLFPLQ